MFTIHFKVRIIELFWLVNFGNIIQSERSLHILSKMIWFIDHPILLAPYFLIVRFIRTVTVKTRNQSWLKSSDRQNNGRSDYLMNRVCPNVRHENITLWSSSWRLKFIHSQFPLPMALNSVVSFETGNLFEGRSPKISIIGWSVHVSLTATGRNYEQFRWYWPWHLIIIYKFDQLMKLIACSYFRLNTNIPFES